MEELVKSLVTDAVRAAPFTVLVLLLVFSPVTTATGWVLYIWERRDRKWWERRFFRVADITESVYADWLHSRKRGRTSLNGSPRAPRRRAPDPGKGT